MKIPYLNEQPVSKEITEEFSGYCNNLRIGKGQWQNQKNMTSDYYPAASSREHRSLQFLNADNSLSEAYTDDEEQSISNTYTAHSTMGAVFCSGSLYALKRIKNAENHNIGCALIKNGENKSYSFSILPKLSLFDNSDKSRFLVRMGSNICVFPDGVVYESENTDEEIPAFKIEAEKTLDDFLISTVYKTDGGSYLDILEYSDNFRVEDGSVQDYLEDKALWANRQTYIKISALSSDNVFASFRENDCLEITTTGSPNCSEITGSLIIKKDKDYVNTPSYKILSKGSENVNGDDRDFIIISGYINDEAHSKAYVNASSFEIRQDLFPTFDMEEGITLKLKRKCPEISLACESQNRIWACSESGTEIYASALGNPYNFYDFSGFASDSYAVNVGTNGAFTACISFLGHPMFFKEDALYVISGSYPSNEGELDSMSYSLSYSSQFKGVEKGSERSLAVIDNILYYKSSCGIVAFDGANTSVISSALGKEKYKNAVAGAYNNKYYVSMQDSKQKRHLFVYDTVLSTWSREDDTDVLQFLKFNNELFFISAEDEKLYSVSPENVLNKNEYQKEEAFEWMCESGNMGYSYPNNKYLSRLQLRLKLDNLSSAAVYIQYDSDGVWHRKGELTSRGIQTHLLPIVPVRCDHMKIMLKGRGDVKIISIAKILEEGGDVG
jgi:hypothetical protein